MAVYTHLSAEDLSALIEAYDVGALISAKGIAEGVSNSNWLVETTGKDNTGTRFILTMYERRIELADLPFFLDLLDHLAAKACPVPRTIHDREGASFRMIDGKAVALIEFLPGVSVDHPTPAQAHSVGRALAKMHLASNDFGQTRTNTLDAAMSQQTLQNCGDEALSKIDSSLPAYTAVAADICDQWPTALPHAICHTDLFPDNVLVLGDQVSALIDFYFACDEAMAYDLAVTHAAWCFNAQGKEFNQAVGDALITGYEEFRPLGENERSAMPLLAQAGCLRFVASRSEDWINTPADALVTRKDPMDFVNRLEFYRREGARAFAFRR